MVSSHRRFIIQPESKETFISTSTQVLSTPAGYQLMRRFHPRLCPNLPTERLESTLNKDYHVKVIAIVQVCYLFAQFNHRLDRGIAISILEARTSLQGFAALGLYFFWYQKLQRAKVQTIINTEWSQNALTFLWIASERLSCFEVQCFMPGLGIPARPLVNRRCRLRKTFRKVWQTLRL